VLNNDYFEPSCEFDFNAIYSKEEDEPTVDYLKESIVLDAVLEFVAPNRRFTKQAACCRLFAILFICRPAFINGNSNITQVEVAEILGVSKQIFNAHVNAFRKRFGFHVNGMRNEDARKKFSKICKSRAGELAEARRKAREKKGG